MCWSSRVQDAGLLRSNPPEQETGKEERERTNLSFPTPTLSILLSTRPSSFASPSSLLLEIELPLEGVPGTDTSPDLPPAVLATVELWLDPGRDGEEGVGPRSELTRESTSTLLDGRAGEPA